MEVVASLCQGRTAAAQCGLFTHKSVPVIFEPPCICVIVKLQTFNLTVSDDGIHSVPLYKTFTKVEKLHLSGMWSVWKLKSRSQ